MHLSSNGTRYMLFAFLALIVMTESYANEGITFDLKIKRGLEGETSVPSLSPTSPSVAPTDSPSDVPSGKPSPPPSPAPSASPSAGPSVSASAEPSLTLSIKPSPVVSAKPSLSPSDSPSDIPSSGPSDEPSYSPSIVVSDSPSIPSSTTSPSLMPSISSGPSEGPSEEPSSTPSVFASSPPSLSPSEPVPSSSPSLSPTYGEKTVTTPFIRMDLTGLDTKLTSSRNIDHWREKVTEFIINYWDEQENSSFVFSELKSHIENQDFFVSSRRRLENENGTKRNLRGPFGLRIIFTQEYTFRGGTNTVPKETYFEPLSKPEFLTFLKAGDDASTEKFQSITSIALEAYADPGPAIASPSNMPSSSPTVIEPTHNGQSGSFDAAQNFLIAFSSVTGVIMLYLVLFRSPWKIKYGKDKIKDADMAAVVTVVGGNVTTPTAGNKSRATRNDFEEEKEEISVAHIDVLAKNSLAFVEEDVSTLGSQEVVSPGKIDLSLCTAGSKDQEADEDDPQYSVDGDDSEINESDSMLSFDVYSNASEDEGSDEFVVVPKGSPRPKRSPRSDDGEGDDKKPRAQIENLVVSGASLSLSKEDGPKIGSTKIIEGKGELRGVKLLAVGDIDEISSPAFSA